MQTPLTLNQNNFARGMVDPEVVGKNSGDAFGQAVRKLENFDINQRGELVKRGGFKQAFYLDPEWVTQQIEVNPNTAITNGGAGSTRVTQTILEYVSIPVSDLGEEDDRVWPRLTLLHLFIFKEEFTVSTVDLDSPPVVRYGFATRAENEKIGHISFTGTKAGKKITPTSENIHGSFFTEKLITFKGMNYYFAAKNFIFVLKEGGIGGEVRIIGLEFGSGFGVMGLDSNLSVIPYQATYGPITKVDDGLRIPTLDKYVWDLLTMKVEKKVPSWADSADSVPAISCERYSDAKLTTRVDYSDEGDKDIPLYYSEWSKFKGRFPEILLPSLATVGRQNYSVRPGDSSSEFYFGSDKNNFSVVDLMPNLVAMFPLATVYFEADNTQGTLIKKLCSVGYGAGGFFFASVAQLSSEDNPSTDTDARTDTVLFWISSLFSLNGSRRGFLVAPYVGSAYLDSNDTYPHFLPKPIDAYAIRQKKSGESAADHWTKTRRMIGNLFLGPVALDRISSISYPLINRQTGLATALSESNGRLHIGTKSGWVLSSWTKSPLGHAVVRPPNAALPEALTAEILGKIASGELTESAARQQTIGLNPTSEWSDDEIYWTDYYLDPASTPTASKVPESEEVEWMAHLRGLMVGTESAEISAQLNELGSVNLRVQHSFEGSNSSVTAKGDYSFFFISRSGKRIHFLNYTEGLRGFQAEDAMFLGGGFLSAGIRDMVWDRETNGLWVLSEDSRIGVFFLNKKYGVEGWTEYKFEIPNGTSETKITNLSNFKGTMGFFTAHPFSYNYLDREAVRDWEDDTVPQDIVGKAELFKVPPKGQKGSASQWTKNVGETSVLTQDCTQLFVGDTYRPILKKASDGVVSFGNIQATDISDNAERFPYLKLRHTKAERCKILETSSMVTINER